MDYGIPQNTLNPTLNNQNSINPDYGNVNAMQPIDSVYENGNAMQPIEPVYGNGNAMQPIEPVYGDVNAMQPSHQRFSQAYGTTGMTSTFNNQHNFANNSNPDYMQSGDYGHVPQSNQDPFRAPSQHFGITQNANEDDVYDINDINDTPTIPLSRGIPPRRSVLNKNQALSGGINIGNQSNQREISADDFCIFFYLSIIVVYSIHKI